MTTQQKTIPRRIVEFLRRHPIICLLLLTPSIPEYLTGSSPFNAVILDPAQFLLSVILNIGLYLPGVLLVREAMVRWKKGWATILLLGAAYAILEEGLGIGTLFTLQNQAGLFGHWLGVNWIWTANLLLIHSVLSIALPILLLGLAIPETKSKNLLSKRTIPLCFISLIGVLAILFFNTTNIANLSTRWALLGLTTISILSSVVLAYKAPAAFLKPQTNQPRQKPLTMAVLGLFFFPPIAFIPYLCETAGLPAALAICLLAVTEGLLLIIILKSIGSQANERHLVALAIGILVPIAVYGVFNELNLPLIVIVDAALGIFLFYLYRSYKSGQKGTASQFQTSYNRKP
jgi:hypothetical protein